MTSDDQSLCRVICFYGDFQRALEYVLGLWHCQMACILLFHKHNLLPVFDINY